MIYQRPTPFASLGFNKQANVGSWIDDKWNKGQQAVTGAYDAASKGIDTAYNAAAGAGNYVRDGLAEAGNLAYNNIENNVVAPAVGAYDSVTNGAREIKNGVGQIGSAAADSVRNTFMAPVNVALGAKNGLVSGASKGLGGAVQGALDGGWNAGKQVGKNYTSASRQFETGLNQAGIAKSAFAQLEKEALAKSVGKVLNWAGKGLQRSGIAAKQKAFNGSLTSNNLTPELAEHLGPKMIKRELSGAREAMRGAGNIRTDTGHSLKNLGRKIDGSETAQNAINYGAGSIAGGAGLYGAHSMGHSSGRKEGVTEGVDQGIGLGLEGAQAMQPGDPGFMGRLGDLFTGTQSGPDAATMRQGLSTERDKLIQSLLAR